MAFADLRSYSRDRHRRQACRRTAYEPEEASVPDEIEETAGIMLVEREALVRRIPGLLDGLSADDRIRLLALGTSAASTRNSRCSARVTFTTGSSSSNRAAFGAITSRPPGVRSRWPTGFRATSWAARIFGGGTHMWASSAVERTATIFLPGPELRRLPWLGVDRRRPARRPLVQGSLLFGHGTDARDAIGDRTAEHLLIFLARSMA